MLINVAIVGCGRIADLHMLGYRGLDGAQVVAVCDTNTARVHQRGREWVVETIYTDYTELLNDTRIDAVEL